MEEVIYKNLAQSEQAHWWFQGRRSIASFLLKKSIFRRSLRILEAGCGTGGNLKMLSEFGKVYAFEPDKYALTVANEKGIAANICFGSLPDQIPYMAEQFDLIAMFDVLEHVEDDQNSLKALYGLLEVDGTLILTVPAFKFLWSEHDDLHQHKRRYTLKELKNKCVSAGFVISKISYFNFFLFPAVALFRFLEKFKICKVSNKSQETPSNLVNTLLCRIFSSERHLLNLLNLPFGVSVIAVLKKR